MMRNIINYSIGRPENDNFHALYCINEKDDNITLCSYYDSEFYKNTNTKYISEWWGHNFSITTTLQIFDNDHKGLKCKDCQAILLKKINWLSAHPDLSEWICDIENLYQDVWILSAESTQSIIIDIQGLIDANTVNFDTIVNVLVLSGVSELSADITAPAIVAVTTLDL